MSDLFQRYEDLNTHWKSAQSVFQKGCCQENNGKQKKNITEKKFVPRMSLKQLNDR